LLQGMTRTPELPRRFFDRFEPVYDDDSAQLR